MSLLYPPDFHSTITYQNANYAFPHDTGLSISYTALKEWFFNLKYVIPPYIKYGNPDFKGNINDIIKVLSNDNYFSLLGATFMRLKSLEEQLDNMFNKLIEWKKTQIKPHAKYQKEIDNYININTYNELLLKVHVIINYIQIMIINVIDYTVIHGKTPSFLHTKKTDKLMSMLEAYINITTINITAGNVIYLIKTIALLNKIYDYLVKHYTIKHT